MPQPQHRPDDTQARAHYLRGNRFFRQRAWGRALAEWRQATRLRQPTPAALRRRRFAQLQAALALLVTVLVAYHVIYAVFPRDPIEMLTLRSEQDTRNWWERFLETGRPAPPASGKLGIRDWWYQLRERMLAERRPERRRDASDPRGGIPERWAELMRRYGRLGPGGDWDLDLRLVSGNGLSRLGAFQQAVAVLQRGIAETKDPLQRGDLYTALANAYYYQGYQLQPDGLARYDLEMVRLAANAYRKALEIVPRPMSLGNMGWMHYLLGNFDAAEEFSRRALMRADHLEYVRLNLGLVYLVQGHIYDAFEQYRTVISRQPGEEVYLGGINDLRELVRDQPGRQPFAHFMIGILAAAQGNYSLSQQHLERFLAHPVPGQSWKDVAREVLASMETKDLEP